MQSLGHVILMIATRIAAVVTSSRTWTDFIADIVSIIIVITTDIGAVDRVAFDLIRGGRSSRTVCRLGTTISRMKLTRSHEEVH